MGNTENQNSLDNKKILPFFAALCLFMATLEYAVPKPLPFLRLGLANLPVLLALPVLGTSRIFLLVLLKTIGQGIISGTLFSYVFLFSAAGSFASAAGMVFFYHVFAKKNLIGFVGLSLTGAICNNMAQLFVARFVLFGDGALLIAPVLFISGATSGFLLGLFAHQFSIKSKWYELMKGTSR